MPRLLQWKVHFHEKVILMMTHKKVVFFACASAVQPLTLTISVPVHYRSQYICPISAKFFSLLSCQAISVSLPKVYTQVLAQVLQTAYMHYCLLLEKQTAGKWTHTVHSVLEQLSKLSNTVCFGQHLQSKWTKTCKKVYVCRRNVTHKLCCH